MIILHDPQCVDYQTLGHPESPARVRRSEEYLRKRHPDWEWRMPQPARDEAILRAHSREHLKRLSVAQDFDVDTAFHPGIEARARMSAGAAIDSMRLAREGKWSFSLMRPPGHHAGRDRAMGFCYLNSIAIAALQARADGIERVAIFDFDAHHGNGTEDIVLGQPGILFASAHEFPGYPGTGTTSKKNAWNWIVAPGEDRKSHMAKLEEAWAKALDFKPELVLVSAGFDAYAGDPITDMTLQKEDFATLGSWLQKQVPSALILEGGYSKELPELIDAFLCAIAGALKRKS